MQRMWWRGCALVTALVLIGVVGLSTAARALAWSPEPAIYGVGETKNVSIVAADGTRLYANVLYPTDPKTGTAAPGPFPVILAQTPYGKDNPSLPAGQPYLVQRGYIDVVADVRGTGASGGEFDFFSPVMGHDGAQWVDFAASLPHSDGRVGLQGASYLGINQFETAADAGSAHVKAMFPVIASNDLYRDTAFAGGFPDLEFDSFYLGSTAALNLTLPFQEQTPTQVTALQNHVHDLADFDAAVLAAAATGGDGAYDQSFWGARNPNQYIPAIVHDHIPAFLIGGWYDLFLRGELMNYSSFQNAADGRPMLGPMSPGQRITPDYQLLMGPWFHGTVLSGVSYHGLNIDGLQLAWFDRWLKGIDTGITDTRTSLHLEDLATGHYAEANGYPVDGTTDTTYYLQPHGRLSTTPPPATGGSDPIFWDGGQLPCESGIDQWSAGALAKLFGGSDPCTQNDTLSQLGPGAANYTTAPVTVPTSIVGPISATLYATTTTTDAQWVVQLSDVAPGGRSTSLTSGLLEGDQRAEDPAMTWSAPDGLPLLPWHPYTQAALRPITPGQLTRFDVEIFPTDDTLLPGHSLRVTISSGDFPHTIPTAVQAPHLFGGIYAISHDAAGPSSIELPIVTGDMSGRVAHHAHHARRHRRTRHPRG